MPAIKHSAKESLRKPRYLCRDGEAKDRTALTRVSADGNVIRSWLVPLRAYGSSSDQALDAVADSIAIVKPNGLKSVSENLDFRAKSAVLSMDDRLRRARVAANRCLKRNHANTDRARLFLSYRPAGRYDAPAQPTVGRVGIEARVPHYADRQFRRRYGQIEPFETMRRHFLVAHAGARHERN